MKKFLILFLSLILVVLCAGCNSTFTPPIDSGINSGAGQEPGNPENPDDPNQDKGERYTVTLKKKSLNSNVISAFYPDEDMDIKAAWTGQGESYSAKFAANGIATIYGLDGSFDVSLTGVPNNYTYDPNGDYVVNRYKRDIVITMLEITPMEGVEGEGTTFFGGIPQKKLAITLTEGGTYRATITRPGQKVYYMITPNQPGKYTLESWVSVKENEINPSLDYYESVSSSYVNLNVYTTYKDGGRSGTYTKNFKKSLQGSSDTDNNWGFRVYADVKPEHAYPVYVDFSLNYEGEADNEGTIVEAKGPFFDTPPANSSQWKYIYNESINGGQKLLDASKVVLNWTDVNANGIYDAGVDGGDGFYHLYEMDAQGNLILDGGKPKMSDKLLYVRLTTDSEVISHGSNNIGGLTGGNGGYGFMWHQSHYGSYVNGQWDENALCAGQGSVTHETRTEYPGYYLGLGDQFYHNTIYFKFIHQYYEHTKNTYGVHPVNAELKTFLELFARDTAKEYTEGLIFDDGSGKAESSSLNIHSDPDAVWMFACGYYE